MKAKYLKSTILNHRMPIPPLYGVVSYGSSLSVGFSALPLIDLWRP